MTDLQVGTVVRHVDDVEAPIAWGVVVDPNESELSERVDGDLPTVTVRWSESYRSNEYVEDLVVRSKR